MAQPTLASAGEQRVDQGAARVARRGMGHEAGGLVDDEQVVILVDHGQRDGLGLQVQRPDLGHVQLQLVTGAQDGVGLDGRAPGGQPPFRDEPLDVRAGEARGIGDEPVGPSPRGTSPAPATTDTADHLSDRSGRSGWRAEAWPMPRSSTIAMLMAASATLKV